MWGKIAAIGAMLVLGACSEEVHYRNRNASLGQDAFERDWYQCQRENTHQYTEVIFGKTVTGPNVDDGMAQTCMRIRGWYPVSK